MSSAWSTDFEPPPPPRTERLVFEPLGEHVVQLDYDAIMGSRARLRAELKWPNDWPADDFTLEDNREDLLDHHAEFDRHEAYAYTVLSPDRTVCLGCIYLSPDGEQARLGFWVVDAEVDTGLETHLVSTVLHWLQTDWPFARVQLAFTPENQRGIALAVALDLQPVEQGGVADHVTLVWHRGA